jgi:hypothetical protein
LTLYVHTFKKNELIIVILLLLINRLEADLESQMKRSGGGDNSMGGKRNDNSSNKASNQGGVGGSGGSMELSELLGVDIATLPTKSNNTSTANINVNATTSDDAVKKVEGTIQAEGSGSGSDVHGQRQNQQMVDILQAQRDRYKDRLAAVRHCTHTSTRYTISHNTLSRDIT